MNVLFITIAWPSPGERNLYSDLMGEFVSRGHTVYVIASQDSHKTINSGIETENGINILRLSSGKIRKTSYFRKAISLMTLGRSIYRDVKMHLNKNEFDLILAPTPPVTFSFLFRKLKKRYNASFYLLLKDIWPQGSVDLKVFRKYGIIWFYLRYQEVQTYKVSDYIGTMSPMNTRYVLANNKFLSKSVVEECPNSIKPLNVITKSKEIRKKYGIPENACTFIFSGNLGKGHGLGFLVDAIKHLSNYNKAFFLIGGSGTHLKFIKEALESNMYKNVFCYSWLPSEDFKQLLGTSDVGMILLDSKYTIPQFPSRLLSYLNIGIPVLCAVNESTDIGTIVEEFSCGHTVIHGDLKSFMNEVMYFSENEEERKIMGRNARKLLMEKYTVASACRIIVNHFEIKN